MDKKILVVEDDELLNIGLCYHLKDSGYVTASARSCREARAALDGGSFDLLLIDAGLPDGDGMALCADLRRRYGVPVILLTARDQEEDVLQGFDSGASDYITKPCSTAILARRIEAVLGRSALQSKAMRCGAIEIDRERGILKRHGEPVQLTMTEWRLLQLLLDHPGQILTRAQILAILWDHEADFVSEHSLTSLVSRLRGKIADEQYGYIKTLYGQGYKWVGDQSD